MNDCSCISAIKMGPYCADASPNINCRKQLQHCPRADTGDRNDNGKSTGEEVVIYQQKLGPWFVSYISRQVPISAVVRLLRLWVRIPLGAWLSVSFECCVLSGRGLCDGPVTRQEESYRMWCVVVCDIETSWMRRPWPTGGCCAK